MADTLRLVDYFYIELSDRPGEGARALSTLKRPASTYLSSTAFQEVGARSSTSYRQSRGRFFNPVTRT
jgi:hypothetical protein